MTCISTSETPPAALPPCGDIQVVPDANCPAWSLERYDRAGGVFDLVKVKSILSHIYILVLDAPGFRLHPSYAYLIYHYCVVNKLRNMQVMFPCRDAYLRGMPSTALALSCNFCRALIADRLSSSSSVAPGYCKDTGHKKQQ